MGRVPEELKERLKREVSIQRLAEARGIKLQRKGRSLMGLCPFHDDRNPSLSIDPVKNEWHCFGCESKGDVIEWVMKTEGVGFLQAVELLRRQHVENKRSKLKPASRRAHARVASAATSVKGLRFASMNALENARP